VSERIGGLVVGLDERVHRISTWFTQEAWFGCSHTVGGSCETGIHAASLPGMYSRLT